MKNTITVCGIPIDECLDTIQHFHSWRAPGLVAGVFLVDLAMSRIGTGVEFDAIAESRHCLPDAIQLFTPCTVGNGWLKVVDWDKFAVTLYDRRSLSGCRVWLDLRKTQQFPLYHGWFMQTIDKKALDHEVLLNTIIAAGNSVLSDTTVCMTDLYRRNKKGTILLCPSCGEAYGAHQGAMCAACQGIGYFDPAVTAQPEPCGHRSSPSCNAKKDGMSGSQTSIHDGA